MTRLERLEMGVAAACGTGIGVMLSLRWPWYVAIPLCVLATGAGYHPWQWIGAVRGQLAPWATTGRAKDAAHAAFVVFAWIAYVALGCIVATVSFASAVAYLMTLDGSLARDPAGAIFLCGFAGILFGGLFFALGAICGENFRSIQRKPKRYKKPMWGLPLSRRLPRALMPTRYWYVRGSHRSSWGRIACVTWKIPVAQALGVYAMAITFVDVILTIGIAAATTRRMAVMASAFAGAVVGTVLGANGVVDRGTAIVAGMGIGGCCGYFWYPVAMALKRNRWDHVPRPALRGGF